MITGINGFVGTNLIMAFRDNSIIHGIDIVPDKQEGVLSVSSWNDFNLAPMVDTIVHLAGKAHDTNNTSAEQEYFDINVGLTKKIFDPFLASNAKKFIQFSSVKAVADTISTDLLTEEVFPDPQTPYGKSKLEAERYILSHSVPVDKKVYILRPCMIHGPGNKGNLNLLYDMVRKGSPYPLGAFQNKRSFTSIQNLTWIIENLIEKDIPSGTYNVADDEPLSTNQIISLMAASLNRKKKIWNVNPELIKQIAKAGDLLHLPLNNERLKKLTESYVVSNKKLKTALGVDHMPVSAVDGMKSTIESFNSIPKNGHSPPVTRHPLIT